MAGIPHVLGNRYEVGDLIGRGGMAEVRLGYDTRLSRSVAIKVLRADLARDPMFLARFRREAQSAAALNHPSIVSVYDTGEEQVPTDDGSDLSLPYIVMEYVKGRTVASLLADGDPVPISEAVQIMVGVLSALEYSHHEGIIHRDIKPGNVMLTVDGKVKVMDFGIARAVADSAATMTQTNSVVGTAQYLSPEQARGEVVDARSDLYSAGCLLYELLTGKPPFTGDSAVAVAYQHVSETPTPASSVAPDIPDSIDRVVMKSLAKRREARYQSAAEFREDLLSAARGEGVTAPSVASWVTQVVTTKFPPNDAAATQVSESAYPTTNSQAAYVPQQTGTYPVNQGTGQITGVQDAVDADKSRKRKNWIIAALIVALLAAIGTGAWAMTRDEEPVAPTTPSASTAPAEVRVPDLSNMNDAQARSALEAAGLKYREGENYASDTVAKGLFVSSDPAPGSYIEVGETVVVHFSSGKDLTTVPDLTGKTTEEAAQILEAAGLSLGGTTSIDDASQKKDRIVSQEPVAGQKMAPGSKIKVNVASGFAVMPDVMGRSIDQAIAELNAAGITHVVVDAPEVTAKYPENTVIYQSSEANQRIEIESIVHLVPAAAPTPEPTPEPTTQSSSAPADSHSSAEPSEAPEQH